MNISIFGLGYVGCVTAACLAKDGHSVTGVDINNYKVDLIRSGKSPLIEPGLEELIINGHAANRLHATTQAEEAIQESEISLVCVGTPSNENGSLDLRYIKRVCQEIGAALKHKNAYHVVVIRSTVLPGTVEETLIPILEQESGLRAGADFGVCMNPEFLREGSAIRDYYQPSFVVIGEIDQRSGNPLEEIYAPVDAPLFRTQIRNAEMVKYACNAFHALKVVFANEIGSICKRDGIDGQEVMEIFVQDRRLNISPVYLRPGYAFGGSCLPKDVRALTYRAKEVDAETAVLNAIMPSNHTQVMEAVRMVERTNRKKIGLLGLSFKPDTDDLRESPAITLAETLFGRGYQLKIFDDKVQLSRLIGANKSFLEQQLPHIAALMCESIEELVAESDVLVVTHGSKDFLQAAQWTRADQVLIDLVGTFKNAPQLKAQYEGIAW
ncbi:MAG TPA: UDP-glucose/GDP-mannose dehydrogenase family protein [Anaerolineales bacterium]|nr:UDP-glucose/GDP-mannose dehydrogenase family protein [Anaerolineales bacterium]